MRRKSERNKSKTSPEKKTAETSRKSRRTSRRRKRSSSRSASEDSDEAPLKVVAVPPREPEVIPPPEKVKKSSNSNSEEDNSEQPIWKVKTADTSSGEIQKIKICLTRPPLTPERTERSPRRRKPKVSSLSEETTSDEKPSKRKTRRSSPVASAEDNSSQDNSHSYSESAMETEKDECLIIDKETNEAIIGEGKLGSSQVGQESEHDEYVQNSQKEEESQPEIASIPDIKLPVTEIQQKVSEVKTVEETTDEPERMEIQENVIQDSQPCVEQLSKEPDVEIAEEAKEISVNIEPVVDTLVSSSVNKEAIQTSKEIVKTKETPKENISEVVENVEPTTEAIADINETSRVQDDSETSQKQKTEALQKKDVSEESENTDVVEVPETKELIEEHQNKGVTELLRNKDVTEESKNKDTDEAHKNTDVTETPEDMSEASKNKDVTEASKNEDAIETSENIDTTDAFKNKGASETPKNNDATEAHKNNDATEALKNKDAIDAPVNKDVEASKNKDINEKTNKSSQKLDASNVLQNKDITDVSQDKVVQEEKVTEEKIDEISENQSEIQKETVKSQDPELSNKQDKNNIEIANENVQNIEETMPLKIDVEDEKQEIKNEKSNEMAEQTVKDVEIAENTVNKTQLDNKMDVEQQKSSKRAEEKETSIKEKSLVHIRKKINMDTTETVLEEMKISENKQINQIALPVDNDKDNQKEKKMHIKEGKNKEVEHDKKENGNEKEKHNISVKHKEGAENIKETKESAKERAIEKRQSKTEEKTSERLSPWEEKMHDSSFENSIIYPRQKSEEKDLLMNPETRTESPDEIESEKQEEEPIRKRRRTKWDINTKAKLPEIEPITTELVLKLCPHTTMLTEEEVKLETEEVQIKEEKKSIIKIHKVEEGPKQVIMKPPDSPKEDESEKEVSNIGLNRKISIVDDEASKLQPPPSPPQNPISSVLFITNLVRPFTLKQLKELLSRTGKLVEDGFWTDKIKSKCYVQYEIEEEAEATRNALHGVQWPIGNGKKLIIDFGTIEAMEAARNPIVPEVISKPVLEKVVEKVPEENKEGVERWDKERTKAPVREWDLGKVPQDDERRRSRERDRERDKNKERSHIDRSRDRSDKRRHSSPSNGEHINERKLKKVEEEDIPARLMDDLFHKTKATPSIYWLPLTPEMIAQKQQERLQRMAEHKRRLEASKGRGGRDFGRGAVRSRRRSGRFDGD